MPLCPAAYTQEISQISKLFFKPNYFWNNSFLQYNTNAFQIFRNTINSSDFRDRAENIRIISRVGNINVHGACYADTPPWHRRRHQPHPVRDGVMEETARSDGRDTSRTARNSRQQSLTCKSSMRITGLIYCLAFIEILHNNEIFGLKSHRASGQSSIERKMCRKFAVEPLYDRTDTRIIITNHIRTFSFLTCQKKELGRTF